MHLTRCCRAEGKAGMKGGKDAKERKERELVWKQYKEKKHEGKGKDAKCKTWE